MSKLDELIAELCPEGVEYKSLGEICEIRSGWGFPNVEQGKLKGDYPFYKVSDMNLAGNETLMTIANNYIDISTASQLGCKPAPEGTIIFPKIGAAIGTNKKRLLSKESCYDNNIMGLIPSEVIISRYLFYQMSSVNLNNFADYSGAMPSIRKTTIEKYIIPLPPLLVQREIVRILDTFTELIAELTARKRQYECYRDKLLSFNIQMGPSSKEQEPKTQTQSYFAGYVPYKPLAEVLTIKNGKDYKKFSQGSVPVYGSGGIIAHIDQYVYDKPSVLIPRKGSLNKLYYVDFPFWTVDTIFYTEINSIIVQPKFVFYFLQAQHLERLNTAGGVPSLTQAMLNKLLIPVPSLSEQSRIVAILDRFDALCNDLSSGLPAEIAARQKQYEYYRDKLLTFKEKSA